MGIEQYTAAVRNEVQVALFKHDERLTNHDARIQSLHAEIDALCIAVTVLQQERERTV